VTRSVGGRLAAVLRVEGAHGLLRRLLARAREVARRAAFAPAPLAAIRRELGAIQLLNLLPFPPEPARGGVAIALADRLEEEAGFRSIALLYHDGRRWRLEARRGARRLGWSSGISPPLSAVGAGDGGLAGILAQLAETLELRSLHVENVAGLPLATFDRLAAERSVVLSTHDFGLFCARPNLLEEPGGTFCGFSTDDRRCARCLGASNPVDEAFQPRRRAAAARLARHAEALIHPSDFARCETARLFPDLPAGRQHVIAPAVRRRSSHVRQVSWPPSRIAFVGQAQRHKGILEFEALVEAHLEHPRGFTFQVAGSGDLDALARLRRCGVKLLGAYRPGHLPDLLARAAVDLALLPSRFPETHSLLLDECLHAGVPVLAAPSGALALRVPALGAGWLTEPGWLPIALERALDRLAADSQALARLQPLAPPAPDESARAHLELYSRLGLS